MKILLYIEKFLAITFWSLTLFGFDLAYIGVLTVISALIHELGHIAALMILNKKNLSFPAGRLYGFRIKTGFVSYKDEIIVALAGPLINLIVATPLLFLRSSPYLLNFALINLMTAFSNLLPIENYDGYKALYSTASLVFKSEDFAARILPRISFFISCAVCFVSLYFMLRVDEGYWIYAIFLSSLIAFIEKRLR